MSLEKKQGKDILRLDAWKNHGWEQVHSTDPRSVIWQAVDTSEPAYDLRAATIASVATEASQTVAQLLEVPDFSIEVALFPHSNYRSDMGLAPSIPDWVQVCGRDKRVCFDVELAKGWKNTLGSLPAEDRREMVHEVGHRVIPQFSSHDELAPLHIREGAVEAVARLLTGIQAELPENTRYITTKLRSELVSPEDIDSHGIFHFSAERPSSNPAALSCLVYLVGAALNLSGDLKGGLLTIRQLAIDSQGMNTFSGNFRETLTDSDPRLLQLAGINYIGDTFPTTSK